MDREACPVKGTAYSGIGGQAVMEGVMMRNKDLYAVAVRKPDGEIVVKKAEYKGVIKSDTPYKIPVIRGVLSFIDSLVLGLSTLNYSSDIYIQSEETEKEDGEKPESEETPITEPVLARTLLSASVPAMRFCSVPSTPAMGRAGSRCSRMASVRQA